MFFITRGPATRIEEPLDFSDAVEPTEDDESTTADSYEGLAARLADSIPALGPMLRVGLTSDADS